MPFVLPLVGDNPARSPHTQAPALLPFPLHPSPARGPAPPPVGTFTQTTTTQHVCAVRDCVTVSFKTSVPRNLGGGDFIIYEGDKNPIIAI